MKIRQNVRHFAARKALELPVVRDVATDKLVDLHTKVSLGNADPEHREERRARLDAFYAATIEMYLAALQEGYAEAEAREITHVVANFEFYNHGWTEMMEFPGHECDAHYERYAAFFDAHRITIDNPLGEFRPADLPDAPATPEKLDDPDWSHTEGGYADDVYVEGPDGEVSVGGDEEPTDVDVADAPGVDDDDVGGSTGD